MTKEKLSDLTISIVDLVYNYIFDIAPGISNINSIGFTKKQIKLDRAIQDEDTSIDHSKWYINGPNIYSDEHEVFLFSYSTDSDNIENIRITIALYSFWDNVSKHLINYNQSKFEEEIINWLLNKEIFIDDDFEFKVFKVSTSAPEDPSDLEYRSEPLPDNLIYLHIDANLINHSIYKPGVGSEFMKAQKRAEEFGLKRRY